MPIVQFVSTLHFSGTVSNENITVQYLDKQNAFEWDAYHSMGSIHRTNQTGTIQTIFEFVPKVLKLSELFE